MTLRLEDNHRCYVCGTDNARGLRLDFEHPEKGVLRTVVRFAEEHQGFKGIVHGGMIAMLLDEMMVNLAWKEGVPAVTAELTVRLKRPARVGEAIRFEGRIPELFRKVLYATATARNEAGELVAEASASCVRMAAAGRPDKP